MRLDELGAALSPSIHLGSGQQMDHAGGND
jgi:hypothetical protein